MFTRTLKRLIAQTSVVAVLFTQLAVAAYACPVVEGPAQMVAAALAGNMHDAMPGCEIADNDNPNLCLQHCQAGDQSVQTMAELVLPMFAAIVTPVVIIPPRLASGPGITVGPVLPEHATSPPPLLRFGALRI